jgi:hypothetical protein
MKPELGTSFSLHYAAELGIPKRETLRAALEDLGFKRLRLMSYWNIHEAQREKYDFSELDWQMDMVAEHGGKVSLCIGKRQPRWPECHMPDWAKKLPAEEWYEALYQYVMKVVLRYRDHPALHSWQLENEAFMKDFGHCEDQDYNRKRIRHEKRIVKHYDPQHQLIMTHSNHWGFPIRGPFPDKYGVTIYRVVTDLQGNYKLPRIPAWWYSLRATIIKGYTNRPTFIHELQAEPWTPIKTSEATLEEQDISMNPSRLRINYAFALACDLAPPLYLWGLEWWYWRKHMHGDPAMWNEVRALVRESQQ